MVPYTYLRFIVAPYLQKEYIRQSVTSYGMSEMSEQSIESIGKVHLKNVCERRGSGQDSATMAIIAKRTTIVTAMGLVNEIISYFKDVQSCKNVSRYKSLWSEDHENAMSDVSWRNERSSFVFLIYLFSVCVLVLNLILLCFNEI